MSPTIRRLVFQHYQHCWNGDISKPFALPFLEKRRRQNAIAREARLVRNRLENEGVSTESVEVVTFIGNGVSTGHAFLHNGRVIVWFPMETYESSHDVQVFVPHEMLHGIHYAHQHNLACTAEHCPQDTVIRFVVEAFATFFTMRLFEISPASALWAGRLPYRDYERWCKTCVTSNIVHKILSGDDRAFFISSDGQGGREAYFLGLLWAQEQFGDMSLKNALLLPTSRLVHHARSWLNKNSSCS